MVVSADKRFLVFCLAVCILFKLSLPIFQGDRVSLGGLEILGGINVGSNATVKLYNVTVCGNRGADYGLPSVSGTNYTSGYGGGIFVHGTLYTYDSVIKDNKAAYYGGDIDDFNIKGKPVVQENDGEDIFLRGNEKLTITGAFEIGASIGVSLEDDDFNTPFTKDYVTYNNYVTPDHYIFSCDGYAVLRNGNEVVFMANTATKNEFIPRSSQIRTTNLTAKNWMAGISGERTLNEINIPAAHDASTKKLSHTNVMGPIGMTYANTQDYYVDELMDMGTRWLDIRLNNLKPKSKFFTIQYKDDGENLYICHGKNETFGGASATYTERNGQIYFEYKGIPAKELGTMYTLKIGADEYQYSVLDYVRACLKSTKVSENTKLLVAATYRYFIAADAYFD